MLVDDGLLERRGRLVDGRRRISSDISHPDHDPDRCLSSAPRPASPEAERAVLERASVIGRVFWRSAAARRLLAGAGSARSLTQALLSTLVPQRAAFAPTAAEHAAEERVSASSTFSLRDAAYLALPKAARAELHESARVDWLETKELERHVAMSRSILGYHLEEAHNALVDLGPRGERAEALGRRAGARARHSRTAGVRPRRHACRR